MASPRDQRSEASEQYRHLYHTKRWLQTRARQLSERPLCEMCLPRVTAASVCDHVDPRDKLDPELFFTGKKQSLCTPHHNSTKQREEKRGYRIGSDEDGMPLDPNHAWNA